MDKEKVRKYIRQELNNREWRNTLMKQFYHDYNRLILKDIVRTEVDSKTNKMINGALKYAVMDHVNKRPDFNDILNDHKEQLNKNLQREANSQYDNFRLKCDSYVTNHGVLINYTTKNEHNSQKNFQTGLNFLFGFAIAGLFGWNMYNQYNDNKNN